MHRRRRHEIDPAGSEHDDEADGVHVVDWRASPEGVLSHVDFQLRRIDLEVAMVDTNDDSYRWRILPTKDAVPENEIAQLRAKLADAEATVALMKEGLGIWGKAHDGWEDRATAFQAALQEIADSDIRYPPHDMGSYIPLKSYDGPCRKIALKALAKDAS